MSIIEGFGEGLAVVSGVFAVTYFPALTRLTLSHASPYPKANVRRRFAAAVVDGSLSAAFVLSYLSSAPIIGLALGASYLLLRDGLWRGCSVGKFLFSLTVLKIETPQPCTAVDSALRNSILVVPGLMAAILESITIYRDPLGHRLGDRIAQTQVVEGSGARELVTSLLQDLRSYDGTHRVRERIPVDR